MLFIAHRGASHDAPENTLAAVSLAWQQNADAVEVDIQLSRDGKIVVIHDDDTRRTAGVNRKVCDQTLAELRSLEAGCWKGREWLGEKIPTLDEILATIPNGKRLFIEIKCGPAIIPELAEALERSRKEPQRIVPIGFSLATMKSVKQKLPGVEVCWIVDFKRERKTTAQQTTAQDLIQRARQAGLDGLDLSAKGPIDHSFVSALKAARLKVYVWTVDSPSQARKLAAAGVNGITTNRPGWLREKLKGT